MIVALRREDDVAFAGFEDVLGAVGSDVSLLGIPGKHTRGMLTVWLT